MRTTRSIFARLGRACSRLRKRARDDRRGIAATEFALLAPVMLLFLLGSVEVVDSVRTMRQVNETAGALSDLTSRMTTIDAAARDDLFATGRALMGRQAQNDSLKFTITSVARRLDSDGEATVEVMWSQTNRGAPLEDHTALTLPTIPVGDSVIITQVALDYPLLYGMIGGAPLPLEAVAVRRPRFSNEVIADLD